LRSAKEERKSEIESAAKRLVDGLGMGSQYKVMGITPKTREGEQGECFPFGQESEKGEKSEEAEKTED
jgi:NADH dehydrogenase [ubiquinone] 1 alpha subcomplex assembly factor 7